MTVPSLSKLVHGADDFLFPVFNMLQLLGVYTPNFQLVFAALQVRAPLLPVGLEQHHCSASCDACGML